MREHGWINHRLYYDEQDILSIIEYGRSDFADDWMDALGERVDVQRAKEHLGIVFANNETSRAMIAGYLSSGHTIGTGMRSPERHGRP